MILSTECQVADVINPLPRTCPSDPEPGEQHRHHFDRPCLVGDRDDGRAGDLWWLRICQGQHEHVRGQPIPWDEAQLRQLRDREPLPYAPASAIPTEPAIPSAPDASTIPPLPPVKLLRAAGCQGPLGGPQQCPYLLVGN